MSKADRQRREAKRGVTLATMPGDVIAEPPQDNGPTPERQAKGVWTVGTSTRVMRDVTATPLHRALHRGAITQQLFAAGEAFLTLRTAAIKIRCGAGQRDSLDLMPRGGGESSPEYEARILAKDAACARWLGSLAGAVESFVVHDQGADRFDLRYVWWQDTHAALDMLALFFGIPDDA
jgi:hypothetical protein